MKKIVDERQELELLKIEQLGFWVLYFAIAADILVKRLYLNVPLGHLIGENIAFILGSVVIIIGCCRRGLWTSHSRPSIKSHLIYSAVFSLLFALLLFLAVLKSGLQTALLAFALFAVICFPVLFIVLFTLGKITEQRAKRLEQKYSEED